MKIQNNQIEKWARIVNEQSGQIFEGIDVDQENLLISYNDSHEDNVDTSLDGNPTVDNKIIKGIPVWSIFKRKRGNESSDGNPLVYALKGERGWRFKSTSDRKNIENQFNSIADKFLKTHSYDVTIIVPSSSILNDFIADTIVKKAPQTEKIKGRIIKMTTYDIRYVVMDKDSRFRKVYSKKGAFNVAMDRLEAYLKTMEEKKDGDFIRHFIPDPKMRNAIDSTLKISDENITRDATKINDHDVLIIDDVVSRGQTIKEMIKLIRENYSPKSITVLTLLSRL